jgi:methyl-accepting chemotaxis protein
LTSDPDYVIEKEGDFIKKLSEIIQNDNKITKLNHQNNFMLTQLMDFMVEIKEKSRLLDEFASIFLLQVRLFRLKNKKIKQLVLSK